MRRIALIAAVLVGATGCGKITSESDFHNPTDTPYHECMWNVAADYGISPTDSLPSNVAQAIARKCGTP